MDCIEEHLVLYTMTSHQVFSELLEKRKSVAIHLRNLQTQAYEILKKITWRLKY